MNTTVTPSGTKRISKVKLITMAGILLGSILTSTTCNAQAALLVLIFGDKIATENFHTSIDLGLNFSNLAVTDGTKFKVGPYFGLGTFIKINDKWALTPEFKPLSKRGARDAKPFIVYTDLVSPKNMVILNYIDVPVLIQYKITPKIMLSTGPQFSFLTSANQQTEGTMDNNGTSQDVTVTQDFQDSFNSISYSIPIEIGYILPEMVKGHEIDLKLRYCIGLNNVVKDAAYGSSNLSYFQFFISLPFVKKEPEAKK
jgi:hypothetical protein